MCRTILSCRNMVTSNSPFLFTWSVVVGNQEEQDAEIVSSGRVSLVPGVPQSPPWAGVTTVKIIPPSPWAKVDGIYKLERVFQFV